MSPRAVKISWWVILGLALVLRVVIVLRGGQFFWFDEGRYHAAESAWDQWEKGAGLAAAAREVMGGADHLGFKVLMLAPAWVQRHTGGSYLVPAFAVSLFSLFNIAWVWRIARRAGADEREALWAMAAMAGTNCMFYWARHLMPYDIALCGALGCLYVAVKPAARFRDSVGAGVLGCTAFVTYNGYWVIVACVLVAHVMLALPRWREALGRAAGGLLGLAGAFGLLLGLDQWLLGVDLLESYTSFAGTISQGDFNEGALVFFDYLWRVERGTALLWALALLASVGLLRRCEASTRRRGLVWAGSIVALTVILILGANVFEKFVVYGRLARQVAPFCALLLGWTAGRIFGGQNRGRGREALAFAALVACAAWSMSTPLRQEFPRPFQLRAEKFLAAYRNQYAPKDPVGTAPEKFKFLYNSFIWPEADRTVQPPHIVLMSAPHPLQWRPYLYEGFNHDRRVQIEGTDITMRLILLK